LSLRAREKRQSAGTAAARLQLFNPAGSPFNAVFRRSLLE
jgi:hypothetical protein